MKLETLTAAVLSGGESRRMGSDKALLRTDGGTTWIERVVWVARSRAVRTIVVTGRSPRYVDLFDPSTAEIVPDDSDVHGKGPLGGILTALRLTRTRHLLCLTCDMPGVGLDAIDELGLPEEHQDVVYASKMFFPMVFRVTPALLSVAVNRLQQDQCEIESFLKLLNGRAIVLAAAGGHANLNTPEDAKPHRDSP
ncbi:MAG TPA: molybdenum cofactor guanylyltransferase [Bdellovibrionota bacterium]|nr:molybdenum cofactor guanylyltransferase [Bdellovibrionota bacterium]